MNDVCAIVVSHNGKRWLEPALSSLYAHAGEIDLDVVVVDNGEDGSAELRRAALPRGAHAALREPRLRPRQQPRPGIADARYVLFINPDTEVLDGELADLVAELDRQPRDRPGRRAPARPARLAGAQHPPLPLGR